MRMASRSSSSIFSHHQCLSYQKAINIDRKSQFHTKITTDKSNKFGKTGILINGSPSWTRLNSTCFILFFGENAALKGLPSAFTEWMSDTEYGPSVHQLNG
jgi:hypothetical protein